jgi:lipid II:glycine glycyltransferase (peptidoglycan interpeptide bridge formation enzyme)
MMQSLHWAAVRGESGGKSLHVGLFREGQLAGGILWHGAAPGAGPAILVAPDGPVLPWGDSIAAAAGMRALMKKTRELAAERDIVALRIEPRLAHPVPPALRDFSRAPVDLCPPETLYLDLGPAGAPRSDEELLGQMHPKWRYNIRLASRRGVTVREEATGAGVLRLYEALTDAAGRGEFFLEPLPFFAALHTHFVEPGLARVLLAEHDGEVLGAMLLVTYGSRATYFYGGTSNAERQRMAGYALQWAAITTARAAGCTTYDFYGFEPHGVPDHLFAGFSRFKRGFGGTPMRFIGAHELVLMDSLADAIVRFVNGPLFASALAGEAGERTTR